jgi:hypothetical protein
VAKSRSAHRVEKGQSMGVADALARYPAERGVAVPLGGSRRTPEPRVVRVGPMKSSASIGVNCRVRGAGREVVGGSA